MPQQVPQISRGAAENMPRELVAYLNDLQKFIADRTSTPVPDVASPDAIDLGTVIVLANELKAAVNELLAAMRAVGLMET